MTEEKRDTYIYAFDVENTTVELGITRDLHARQTELRREYPDEYSFIEQVGFEPLTRAEAERELKRLGDGGWPINMETLNLP